MNDFKFKLLCWTKWTKEIIQILLGRKRINGKKSRQFSYAYVLLLMTTFRYNIAAGPGAEEEKKRSNPTFSSHDHKLRNQSRTIQC